jgi:predicted ABC-type ATPase
LRGEGKDIFILGGPNGAGKTTAARILLTDFLREHEFLNADEIARTISPEKPETAAIAAGRVFLERMRRLIQRGNSFALETTCAGKSYLNLFRQCKSTGWRITLLYLWLSSSELAVQRVARRMAEGGHGIPPDVIRRRYEASAWNMRNLYLPLADQAEIYDNSLNPRVLIAEKRSNQLLQICDPERWQRIVEVTR